MTETFTTSDLNQLSIQLKPFQGESPLVSFNQQLGHFEVTEISPANPREPLMYVTFQVDAQGELSITAWDEGTGRALPVLADSGAAVRLGRPWPWSERDDGAATEAAGLSIRW